jgi:hypothetical protein
MLRHMPRSTPGLKPHKTPPAQELVADPEPAIKSSEHERGWQELLNVIGHQKATYRKPKPEAEPKAEG